MFFSSKKVVGLDIGSSTIKMAEFDFTKQGAMLRSFGMLPTPVGAFNTGDILDSAAISNAILEIFQQFSMKRKNVASSLSGSAVIVKKVTIPRIEKKLISEQIRWEAEQYIPFDINSINLCHYVVPTDPRSENMEVLLVAAQKEIVNLYFSTVAAAKLNLSILDVSGFAIANAFEFSYGKMPGQTIALLDIGASKTSFTVVHNSEVIFNRDMSIGGQAYTYEIHKEMGISISEAESLKLSAMSGEGVPDEVHSIVNATTSTVKDEIRNSLDYFSGAVSGITIGSLFVSGGAAQTVGLVEAISQVTELRCEPFNSLMRVQIGKGLVGKVSPALSNYLPVLLGLSLRKVGDHD